mmetsp:Transcript_15262/g.44659  ORF Transcript_15262/g.44659 Transcript_15262/m.44659 type:complete len:208 (-) Transcript_15262:311-934(-)
MMRPVAATGNSRLLETALPPTLLPPLSLQLWPRSRSPPPPPQLSPRSPPRGRPPPPPPLSSSSASCLTRLLARSTCSGVPVIVTRQRPSPFSTWTRAPLCCRTSEIFEPRVPMMPPMSDTGNSSTSLVPPPDTSGAPPPPELVLSATSAIMALARLTASGVPEILNSHMSSFLSSASILAPLFSRMLLIVEPDLPMTRPMICRGSLR